MSAETEFTTEISIDSFNGNMQFGRTVIPDNKYDRFEESNPDSNSAESVSDNSNGSNLSNKIELKLKMSAESEFTTEISIDSFNENMQFGCIIIPNDEVDYSEESNHNSNSAESINITGCNLSNQIEFEKMANVMDWSNDDSITVPLSRSTSLGSSASVLSEIELDKMANAMRWSKLEASEISDETPANMIAAYRRKHVQLYFSEPIGLVESFWVQQQDRPEEKQPPPSLLFRDENIDLEQAETLFRDPFGRHSRRLRGPCRYGYSCQRPNCWFQHPAKRGLCRYGDNCHRPDCWFDHPKVVFFDNIENVSLEKNSSGENFSKEIENVERQ